MKPTDSTTPDRVRSNRRMQPPGVEKTQQRRGAVTRELYERMFQIYVRDPSISRVQETCGVAYQTAKKAVEEGWPERGFEAIRDRFARVAMEAQRREENDPRTVIGENLALIRTVKGRLRDAAKATGVKSGDLIRITDSLDKVLTREHVLLQAAIDAGMEGGGGVEDQIATLDDAALEGLAMRGELPPELVSFMAPGYVPERDPNSHLFVAPDDSDGPPAIEPPPIAEDIPDLLAAPSDPPAPAPQPARVPTEAPTKTDGALDLESLSERIMSDSTKGKKGAGQATTTQENKRF